MTKNNPAKRAAIYARYAAKVADVDKRLDACDELAFRLNADVTRREIDCAGGPTPDRPDLRKLFKDVRAGVADVFANADGDRLSRDPAPFASLRSKPRSPVAPGADLSTAALELNRASGVRLMAGRLHARARREALGLPEKFPYVGRRPKIGRQVHAAIRGMYYAACKCGADRAETARILNDLARSIEVSARRSGS